MDYVRYWIGKHPDAFAWLALILLAIIWGSVYILIKYAVKVYQPIDVSMFRFAMACVFLAPIAFKNIRLINKYNLPWLISSGLLGVFLPNLLFAIAGRYLPSALSAVLNALVPLFTFASGIMLFGQSNQWRKALGIAIGFSGSVLLIVMRRGSSLTPISTGEYIFYATLVVIACIFYGVNNNIVKFKLMQLPVLAIPALSLWVVLPFALISLTATGFVSNISFYGEKGIGLLYITILGMLCTGFAQLVYTKLIKVSNATFASSVTYLIPAVALIISFVDGEAITLAFFIGLALNFAGVYLVNLKPKNNNDSDKPLLPTEDLNKTRVIE